METLIETILGVVTVLAGDTQWRNAQTKATFFRTLGVREEAT